MQWLKRLLVVLAISAALLRIAQWVFVPTLPFDPIAYDGQRVRLEGKVAGLKSEVSRRGNQYHFFVLATSRGTVVVFMFGTPRCGEGQRATVEGVFHHEYQRSGEMFRDEIDASSITCE